jgi:hypothetical protein
MGFNPIEIVDKFAPEEIDKDQLRLRDELVFGDDTEELGVPDDPNPFNSADQDKAGKP